MAVQDDLEAVMRAMMKHPTLPDEQVVVKQYGSFIRFSAAATNNGMEYIFQDGDEVFHITAEDILEMATWANSVGMLAKDACILYGLL